MHRLSINSGSAKGEGELDKKEREKEPVT